ncbi:MAG: tannase/feruloyl esterase family alpha/beta hydrolase [Gammaproteobacteria bacterium]|nr:tannase/feruloyl esterase family alpha/beta hydrolase [Gammaproteobacteria bacterium]
MTNALRSALVRLPAIVALVYATALAAAAQGASSCRNLYRLTDLQHAIEPGIRVEATDELPTYCRVRGVINRAIRFEVTLPEAWNGRLMFEAVGGSAGVIGDTTSLLDRGFAQASTDTGHEFAEGNDFVKQPEALLDYAYRGVHLATRASKRVIAHYYGRDIDHAYLQGCSNGGRAAMLEAARFPEDYDGIIAGAPAFQFQEFMPWMVAVGRRQAAHPLDRAALEVLDDASRSACDALDGVIDGVINDPRICRLDLDSLVCAEGESKGCLSAGQLETARFIYEDMIGADGNVQSPGVPPGAEAAGDWGGWILRNEALADAGGSIVGDLIPEMLTFLMRHDAEFKIDEFDPVGDYESLADPLTPLDLRTADLSEFRDRGGKLLIYQGWNDFPLRPQRAIAYLESVEQAMGGADATADFFRMFMVPGMVHCAGGPGAWEADYVDPLVKWTEQGEAPERIVATHPGPTEFDHLDAEARAGQDRTFTRPLCAYPKLAQYDGEGDPDNETNFRCAAP